MSCTRLTAVPSYHPARASVRMFPTQPWLKGAGISWITTSRAVPSGAEASVITSKSCGAMVVHSAAGACATSSPGEGGAASSCACAGAASASSAANGKSDLVICRGVPPAPAKRKPPLAHCTDGRGPRGGVRRGCLIRAAPTRKWIIARNRALAPYCPRIGLRFASGAARRAALLRRYRAVRLSADRVLPIVLEQRSGRVAKENAEQWPSGRRRTPGKCVYGNPVSRVRIPPAPPPPFPLFSTGDPRKPRICAAYQVIRVPHCPCSSIGVRLDLWE